jgi:dTDP-4-dehydrorhamnose 3,5-epimerase-like enzyme
MNQGSNYIYFLPNYCAHAYFAVKKSQIIYFFEKKHKKKYDLGINPTNIIKNTKKMIISKRDLNFPKLVDIKKI